MSAPPELAPDEDRCAATTHGRRCSLRKGHFLSHEAWENTDTWPNIIETPEQRQMRLGMYLHGREMALPTGVGSRSKDGRTYPAVYEPQPGKCNQIKRYADGLCQRPAGAGTDHLGFGPCRAHRGNIKAIYDKAMAEKHDADARKLLGVPKDIDPAAALRHELARSQGNVEWLEDAVGQLGPESLFGEDGRVNPMVELAQDKREWLAKVAKLALDASIAQRKQDLDEATAQLVAEGLRRLIAAYKLPNDQRLRSILHEILTDLGMRLRTIEADARPRIGATRSIGAPPR